MRTVAGSHGVQHGSHGFGRKAQSGYLIPDGRPLCGIIVLSHCTRGSLDPSNHLLCSLADGWRLVLQMDRGCEHRLLQGLSLGLHSELRDSIEIRDVNAAGMPALCHRGSPPEAVQQPSVHVLRSARWLRIRATVGLERHQVRYKLFISIDVAIRSDYNLLFLPHPKTRFKLHCKNIHASIRVHLQACSAIQ